MNTEPERDSLPALRDEFTPPEHARRYDRPVSIQHDGPLMVATVEVVYIWKVAVW